MVDLNADLGERFGLWSMGDDAAMLAVVDRANVACGFHAGDAATMIDTCTEAARRGVMVGAHVGYRDLAGFGRRDMAYAPRELTAETLYQIGALEACARRAGTAVSYVKPHGALYNRIAWDRPQAEAVFDGLPEGMPIMLLAGCEATEWARERGIEVIEEAFIDRAYTAQGRLMSRSQPGAVLHDPEAAVAQAVAFARGESITSVDGQAVSVRADSLCVHGDNPAAVELARRVAERLDALGLR